jgi:hypothetical protein
MKRVFVLMLGIAMSVAVSSAQQPVTSIKDLLREDGTPNLKTGFKGNVNVQGCQMVLDKNGAPRFLSTNRAQSVNAVTTSDDDYWDATFSIPTTGVNNQFGTAQVYAVAFFGDTLFVGGWFETAGEISAIGIAQWDGSQWSTVGTPPWSTAVIRAFAVIGNDLYVGGSFTNNSGGSSGIIKWTGSSWVSVGGGLDPSTVNAFAVNGTDLYVGGGFHRVFLSIRNRTELSQSLQSNNNHQLHTSGFRNDDAQNI